MTPDDWLRVKKVAADALEIQPPDRPAFVRAAVAGDSGLAEEVFNLIGDASALESTFLEPSPWKAADIFAGSARVSQRFAAGEVVCDRFEILRYIASGGMGDVYEAWDRDLREAVALKTIRPLVALRSDAAEHFKEEVRQARRIPHSNVCNIHDLFCHRGHDGEAVWFLSMELLPGRTLADRLRDNGPLPEAECLSVALDLIGGIGAAHSLGIVHRDLKPGNIMLSPRGGRFDRAVITDFGVARTVSEAGREMTGPRGTVAYMAPEQARGQPPGPEADVYALGVVICETLTGERPPPPVDTRRHWDHVAWIHGLEHRHRIGKRWSEALVVALDPDPAKRCRDVAQIGRILTRPSRVLRRALATAAVLLPLGAIGLLFASAADRIVDARQITPGTDLAGMPSITPDGKFVAYASDGAQPGNLDIWIKQLPDGIPKRLTTDPASDDDPGISPDGSSVAYRSERAGGGVYLVDANTGVERLLAPGGRSPRFSPDGKAVAYWTGDNDDSSPTGRIYLMKAIGGEPERLAADFLDARAPRWHDSADELLFQGCRATTGPLESCEDWWVMKRDGSRLHPTGAMPRLRAAHIEPHRNADVWAGKRIFFAGRQAASYPIWEIGLSADYTSRTDPVRLSSSLSGELKEVDPSFGVNGAAAFEHLLGTIHIYSLSLGPGGGDPLRVTSTAATDTSPRISRDGRVLVFARREDGLRDIWKQDLLTKKEELLARSDGDAYWPMLDDSKRQLVFESRGGSHPGIYIADGAGVPRRLCPDCSNPTSWFAGDRAVFYKTPGASIALLDAKTGQSRTVIEAPAGMLLDDADWSPATQRLLFTAAGKDQHLKRIYSVAFPAGTPRPAADWKAVTLDSDWVDRPRWSFDGSKVYYVSGRDGFYCVWGVREGEPAAFPVYHFHNPRVSPAGITFDLLSLSATNGAIYLDVGETAGSIWTGRLTRSILPLRFF